MFCPKCGTKNEDDATFCVCCGTKIDVFRQAGTADALAPADQQPVSSSPPVAAGIEPVVEAPAPVECALPTDAPPADPVASAQPPAADPASQVYRSAFASAPPPDGPPCSVPPPAPACMGDIPDYLAHSIIITLLSFTVCCFTNCFSFIVFIIGIIAIVFASKASRARREGNYAAAVNYSHNARTLCMVAVALFCASVAFTLLGKLFGWNSVQNLQNTMPMHRFFNKML